MEEGKTITNNIKLSIISIFLTIPGSNPELFGFSICSTDGSQYTYKSDDIYFPLQDCIWPFTNLFCIEENGDKVCYHKKKIFNLLFKKMNFNIGNEPISSLDKIFTLNSGFFIFRIYKLFKI